MFSFLNSGILILSSAIVIPILIYLFAKKKPRKIIFSTIRFIKESQKKQRRKINIKNLLLLILRMLIILFTILAISRPALKAPFLDKGNLHPQTAIALIIDNSYSMDFLIDTQTELEKAKSITSEINEIISKDDITLILTLNKDWNNLNGNLIYGKIPEDLITNISITPQAHPLKEVIALASGKLKESHLPNQEIYFITDFQEQELPEKIDIPTFFIPTTELENKNNISCQNVQLTAELTKRTFQKILSFEVVNHADFSQQDIICQLFFEGQTTSEKVVDLQPFQRKKETFAINLEKSGWHSGYVQVKNERLPFDNRNYFSFFYNLSPEVAVISDANELPIPLQTILEIYTNNPENIRIFSTENLNYETLKDFENIIVFKKQKLSTKLEFILDKLQKNKKGILFIADRNLSEEWQNYLGNLFSVKFEEFRHFDKNMQVTFINKFHPITNLLGSSRNITFNDTWKISSSSDVLLQALDFPLALEKDKICLWLFDIESLQNPFLLDSSFPVFAYNCLQFLCSEINQYIALKVGSKIKLDSPFIELPSGNTIQTNEQYFICSSAGIYKLDNRLASINLDYAESDFKRITTSTNKHIKFLGADWKKHILQTRYGFEIWKILLIVVLLLFALEMLLIKKEEGK